MSKRYTTELGKLWKGRRDASEQYYKSNSKEWEALRQLLIGRYEMVEKWGANVAMGWAVIKNLIGITYYKNPDPRIQPIAGAVPKEIARMFESVFRGIHKRQNTEEMMRSAFLWESFAGYAVQWTDFEQEDGFETIDVMSDPTYDEEGNPLPQEPMQEQIAYPIKQEIVSSMIEPYDLRVDPDGRKWNFADHKWISIRYTKTLQEILDDPDYINTDILTDWVKANRKQLQAAPDSPTWSEKANHKETDPRYLLVPCEEIWSKVEKRVVHFPVGADFEIADYPWPESWKRANRYPAVFIAINEIPGDSKKKEGFYPKPTLGYIRSQLENLNRLEGLFLETATLAVRKYLYIKGLLADDALAQITNTDVNRDMIPVDLQEVAKQLAGQGVTIDWSKFDLRTLLMLLPQEDRSDAMRHAEAIEHELNLIYQITGQGPGDRGGLAEANSATEALNLAARFEQRIDERVQQAGKFYNQITENFWLVLKEQQTLPIHYQLLVDEPDVEAVWSTFKTADLPADIDLVFEHVTGSSRARNRAQDLLERKEIFAAAAPILANAGKMQEVLDLMNWSVEPSGQRLPDSLRSDTKRDLARQIAAIDFMVQEGQIMPEDAANEKAELTAALVSEHLAPADLQQVAQMISQHMPGSDVGGATEQVGAGSGSLRKAKSAGQLAASQAAAGAVGGLG